MSTPFDKSFNQTNGPQFGPDNYGNMPNTDQFEQVRDEAPVSGGGNHRAEDATARGLLKNIGLILLGLLGIGAILFVAFRIIAMLIGMVSTIGSLF